MGRRNGHMYWPHTPPTPATATAPTADGGYRSTHAADLRAACTQLATATDPVSTRFHRDEFVRLLQVAGTAAQPGGDGDRYHRVYATTDSTGYRVRCHDCPVERRWPTSTRRHRVHAWIDVHAHYLVHPLPAWEPKLVGALRLTSDRRTS